MNCSNENAEVIKLLITFKKCNIDYDLIILPLKVFISKINLLIMLYHTFLLYIIKNTVSIFSYKYTYIIVIYFVQELCL